MRIILFFTPLLFHGKHLTAPRLYPSNDVSLLATNRYSHVNKMITEAEKSRCVLWYHESKSTTKVQREFKLFYNCFQTKKSVPSHKSIRKWYRAFLENGDMKGKKRGRPASTMTDDRKQQVSDYLSENGKRSIRNAALDLNLKKSSVHRIARKLKFYPYKISVTHALKKQDKIARVTFARTMLLRVEEDMHYLRRIAFSDEATFHVSGVVHRHNVRIWARENPRAFQEYDPNSPKINVWCGLTIDRVIGPYFFEGQTVNKEAYLNMLQTFAYPILTPIDGIIFQQDGSPVHWARIVRQSLNQTFPERWIGRDGPTAWPARSPDITPLDFFFWGYVKERVFHEPVDNIDELKRRITTAIRSVNNQMLINTWGQLHHRLRWLTRNRGGHIEVYRQRHKNML